MWSVVAIAFVPEPVDAHGCATPARVEMGTPVAVPVGITAEATAVTGIDIELPASFRLATVQAPRGWMPQAAGRIMQLRGGEVAPFGCGYVTLRGTFTEKGVVALPLVLHHPGGATVRLTGREPRLPDAAQLVYAGVEMSGPDEDAPRRLPVPAAVAVTGALVATAAIGVVVNRRLRRGR